MCNMPNLTSDGLLNETEAAELLHQEPRTLRLWRKRRGLPHLKVSAKTILYRKSDVMSWLENFRVATACV